MTEEIRLHVGESLDEIGARAISAWHRMERGEAVNEKHISFETWETMVRVLSPKRLELLRHLHQSPAKNIRALALGRNYRGCMRTWRRWRRRGCWTGTRRGCGRSMIRSMWR